MSSHQTFFLMKTSFVFVFRRRLQDVLIKTDVFAFAIRLQKMSSRRLQDVLIKTNIFVLAIRLQDIFKMSCKDVFKTFPRHIIRLNCFPRSRICLGHTSLKFLSVQKICKCDKIFSSFSFSLHYIVQWLLTEGVFRTWSNIYKGAFFAKTLNGFKVLTVFEKKSSVADFRQG